MIKLKRVVTDKGFILEETNSDKINKELIDDGAIKPVELPHVENNPESVQDHIDAIKEIVDKEKEKEEKKALETKSEDRAIFAESKLFKDRSEMSSFIVKLKEQKIKHRVLPLHEDKEGYKFELRFEKPLNEELNESYETAFEVCEDGSKISAVGSFKHTRNYTHELVDFDCASGSGSGDYRWMNRPWQRFTFAEALREAMINAGVDEACAKECIDNSFSLKSAVKYFAEHCCKKEESKPEECLKESKVDVAKCKDILNNQIDWTDVDETGDVDFARNQLRSMESEGAISKDEYDYITTHWDELLDESLKEDKEEPKETTKEPETFDEKMDFLAKDEDEAIAGYEKILATLDEEDAHVIEQLNKILEEERAHKEFLEAVKKDHDLEYSHEHEEEPKEDDFDELEDGEEIVDVEEDDFDWEPSLDESKEESKSKKENMWDFGEEDD